MSSLFVRPFSYLSPNCQLQINAVLMYIFIYFTTVSNVFVLSVFFHYAYPYEYTYPCLKSKTRNIIQQPVKSTYLFLYDFPGARFLFSSGNFTSCYQEKNALRKMRHDDT